MIGRLILYVSAFGLSDIFVKNKSIYFKFFYYSILMIIALYFIFNKYIHEKLLSNNRKRK
jgi:hypothetical protein